jgi:hypothetical protein
VIAQLTSVVLSNVLSNLANTSLAIIDGIEHMRYSAVRCCSYDALSRDARTPITSRATHRYGREAAVGRARRVLVVDDHHTTRAGSLGMYHFDLKVTVAAIKHSDAICVVCYEKLTNAYTINL